MSYHVKDENGFSAPYLRAQTQPPEHRYVKPPGHPSDGEPCAACGEPLVAGDITTLIPLGPGRGRGDDVYESARAGRWYSAVAVEIHWDCAGGAP